MGFIVMILSKGMGSFDTVLVVPFFVVQIHVPIFTQKWCSSYTFHCYMSKSIDFLFSHTHIINSQGEMKFCYRSDDAQMFLHNKFVQKFHHERNALHNLAPLPFPCRFTSFYTWKNLSQKTSNPVSPVCFTLLESDDLVSNELERNRFPCV